MADAQVLAFPTKPDRPSCHTCRHARHGTTTFCTMMAESIHDEITVAAECPDFEKET